MKYRPPRYAARMTAGVIRDGVRHLVHIENVSQGGLRLAGLRSVLAGDQLTLHILGELAPVVVRWVDRHRCGVEFVDAQADLRATAVRNALLRLNQKQSAQHRRPG